MIGSHETSAAWVYKGLSYSWIFALVVSIILFFIQFIIGELKIYASGLDFLRVFWTADQWTPWVSIVIALVASVVSLRLSTEAESTDGETQA